MYSKFGFMYTDIKLGEEEYILIREDDVIGIMPRAGKSREPSSQHSLLIYVLHTDNQT